MPVNRLNTRLRTAVILLVFGASAAAPAAAGARSHHHPKRHHHSSGIPQHNGGDRDSDNRGGPTDGDGNV